MTKSSFFTWLGERSRRFFHDKRAVVSIELAAVAPPLVIGLVIGADMAMNLHTRNRMMNAAQAATQYAVLKGYDVEKIKAAASNATSLTGLVIPDPEQFCACPTATGLKKAACGQFCVTISGNGSGLGTAANYLRIQVKKNYTPMFEFNKIGDQTSTELVATTTVRMP